MKKVFAKIGEILSYALVGVELAIVIMIMVVRFSGNIPSFFGYKLFVVSTGSMVPELEVGDVILSKTYHPGDAIRVGDVITYNGRQGELAGKLITHKVILIEEQQDGLSIVPKGVANHAADPKITDSDVDAIMVRKLVVFGWLFNLMSKPVGFILLFILPMAIFIAFECKDFVKILQNKEGDGNEKNV